MESAEGANFSSSSKCFHSGTDHLLPVWGAIFTCLDAEYFRPQCCSSAMR